MEIYSYTSTQRHRCTKYDDTRHVHVSNKRRPRLIALYKFGLIQLLSQRNFMTTFMTLCCAMGDQKIYMAEDLIQAR